MQLQLSKVYDFSNLSFGQLQFWSLSGLIFLDGSGGGWFFSIGSLTSRAFCLIRIGNFLEPPTTGIFSKVLLVQSEVHCCVSLSSKLRSQKSTALQMGRVLRYKLDVYCSAFKLVVRVGGSLNGAHSYGIVCVIDSVCSHNFNELWDGSHFFKESIP